MKNQPSTPSTIITKEDIQEEISALENTNESGKKSKSKLQIIEQYLNNKYSMRLNTILCLPEFKIKSDRIDYKVMNENSIYRELEHNGYRCQINTIRTLLKSDFLPEFNPIQNYFETNI